MEIESKFLRIVRLINLFSMLFLVVELSLYINIFQRLAFAVAFISYTIEAIVEKKWKQFKWDRSSRQIFFIIVIFFFVLQFIFFPFEKNTSFFGTIIEERIPFLIFGIVGLFGFNKYFKLKYFAWTFIATSFILGAFLLSNLNSEILSSVNRNELLGLVRIKYINSHMKFNYYLNVSLICIYYIIVSLKGKKAFWQRLSLVLSSIVIILNLFLSEGRIGLLSSIIILVIYIVHYFWEKSKRLTLISTSLFILLVTILIQQNPRLSTSSIKHEPRQEIWAVAYDEIVKSNFLGVGASTAAYDMKNQFAIRGMINNKHTHNILLQSTLEYGVLGFVVILSMFVFGCYTVSANFRFMVLLLTLITFLQLFVGSFERDLNPMVYLLTIILIVQQDKFENSQSHPSPKSLD
ncbi:MAG: O-antigen ligase family protein [Paludibacter sp.]|nr:O-antigen ligase family protein [Paludibacter sp.]